MATHDCKRIPYDTLANEKLRIAEITGTKLEKNDIRYYKVRWEQSWIPASRLKAWQDLVIQFWEGYHSSNDPKVMELDSCDQTPPVYVLTSDSETREDLQAASTNSEKRNVLETEQDISSSVNFDTFTEEEYSDTERHDDMMLDNDKVSILGHKRLKARTKRLIVGKPYIKDADSSDHTRPEATSDSLIIKEELPYAYHHMENSNIEGNKTFASSEKSIGGGEQYNSVGYRASLSPTPSRESHDFQMSSTTGGRNSISPQEQMVSYDVGHQATQKTHQGYKAYYCYLCGKEYRSNTGLKQHLLAHKNEKPFGCNVCQRRYRWKGDLNRHMYTHLPNDELPLKCPECQKGFVRKDKMHLHINFAHGGGTGGGTGCEEPPNKDTTILHPSTFSNLIGSGEEQNKVSTPS